MTQADRIHRNMGQQTSIDTAYLLRVIAGVRAIIRTESHNAVSRKQLRAVSMDERINTEFEIQSAELLLSEIEVAYRNPV